MAQHNIDGNKGEQLAAEWLIQAGYIILETNYRYRHKEIDIIATQDNLLVIVEVKLRNSKSLIAPQEAVDLRKIKNIIAATNHYVKSRRIDKDIRFDIIAITHRDPNYHIEHIPDAFFSPLF